MIQDLLAKSRGTRVRSENLHTRCSEALDSEESMTEKPQKIGRRQLLKGAVASPAALASNSLTTDAAQINQRRDTSLIQRENEKAGTRDWQLTRVRINRSPYRTSLIEGYCAQQSVAACDQPQHPTVPPPPPRFWH